MKKTTVITKSEGWKDMKGTIHSTEEKAINNNHRIELEILFCAGDSGPNRYNYKDYAIIRKILENKKTVITILNNKYTR